MTNSTCRGVNLMLVMSGTDRDKLLRLVKTAAAPFYGSQSQRKHNEQPKQAAAPTTSLGDNRFQELIRAASAFFAQAERHVVD